MKNEDKIVEFLSEMLHKFDVLNDKVENLNKTFNKRLGGVEKEMVKLNLISSQNSSSLLKPGDNIDRIKRQSLSNG
jgi:hypothetical protein